MPDTAHEVITFGQYLRTWRRAHDLTQEELARSVPCSRVTIQRIEAEELRPSKELAAVLADRLGVPKDEVDHFVGFARGTATTPPVSKASLLATAGTGSHPLFSGRGDSAGLSAGPARGHTLPAPLTVFVGRTSEIAEISRLLAAPACRLLTLTGPGGAGKTRLALAAAAALASGPAAAGFSDGACFVPLGALTDATLVAPTIAEHLGLQTEPGRPPIAALTAYLKDRRLLLVLDGFEGLLDAAPLAGDLLARAPDLKILVTSRSLLGLSGEHNYPVAPLECPPADEVDTAQVLVSPAVQLFALRADAVQPGFVVDSNNAAAVAEVCRRVDGLPLAIELAAARMALLSPQALLARLEHRLQILIGGPRDQPERQRTLRSTIGWSYQLLNVDEQRIFRQLAVFAGGWDLPGAEAVALTGAIQGAEALEAMSSLAGKSLIQPKAASDGQPRFAMLDTIREFGLEQLAQCGEEDAVRRLHAAFYLKLAEDGETGLKGHEQMAWARRLATEQDNLRAALGWTIGAGDAETAMRLAAALQIFWERHGNWNEGSVWLERALALPGGSMRARARALAAAAMLQVARADAARALDWLSESRALAQETGDQSIDVTARMIEGWIWMRHRDAAAGAALMEEALTLARTLRDRWLVAWILYCLAWELSSAGLEPERMRAASVESLALFEACGDRMGRADVMALIAAVDGLAVLEPAAYQAAMARMEEAASLFQEFDARSSLRRVLSAMGNVARTNRDFARAHAAYDALEAVDRSTGFSPALVLASRGGLMLQEGNLDEAAKLLRQGWAALAIEARAPMLAWVLAMLAAVLAGRDQRAAAKVLSCALAELNRGGAKLDFSNLAAWEPSLAAVPGGLDRPPFDAAWEAGQEMTLDEGYEFATRYLAP